MNRPQRRKDGKNSPAAPRTEKKPEIRAGRWEIIPTEDFKRDMRRLDREIARRATQYLYALRDLEDPRARGKALTGPLSGVWRFRVAKDYRLLAQIDNNKVTILGLRLRHRSKSYD